MRGGNGVGLARGKHGERATAGERFGRYRLLGRIATGGMAEVFAAELLAPGGFRKAMVIKRMLPHLAESPRVLEMFMEEARVAARLSHVNVCSVFELGDVDGEFYIAMEYLRGAPLTALSRATGPLPPHVAVAILSQACEGLHYAHEQCDTDGNLLGLVHRDVSPHNLLLTADGVIKVLDFGIAKVDDSSRENTEFGKVKGKLPYMSPEQLAGQPLDRRSDVWALGVVLWELLAGRRLFRAPGPAATVDAIRHGDIPDLASIGITGAEALDVVLGRALCRSREWRFATAMDLKRAMVDALHAIPAASNDELAQLLDDHCGEIVAATDRLFTGEGAEEDDDGVLDRLPLRAEPTRSTDVSIVGRALDDLGDESDEQELNTVPTVEIFGASSSRGATYTEPDVGPEPAAAPVLDDNDRPRRSRALMLALIGFAAACGVVAAVLVRGGQGDRTNAVVAAGTPDDSHERRETPPPSGLAAVRKAAAEAQVAPQASTAAEGNAIAGADTETTSARAETDAAAVAKARAEAEARAKAKADAAAKVEAAAKARAEAAAAAKAQAAAAKPAESKKPSRQTAPRRAPRHRQASSSKRAAHRESQPPAEPGRMTLDARPWATIYLDGKKIGTTPLVGVQVPAGHHTIKAVTSDGKSKTERVNVPAGGELRRRFRW